MKLENQREGKRQLNVTNKLDNFHSETKSKKGKVGDALLVQNTAPPNYFNCLTYKDRALCAQAHWFIYAPSSPSIEIFHDPGF